MNKRMNVIDWLSEATGISQRCLRSIHTEFLANDGKFISPINRYTVLRVRMNTDSFNSETIQRVVNHFYITKKYPTLSAVLEKWGLMESLMEAGSVYGNFFKAWGSPIKKADSKQFLYEQHDIIEQRHT